MTLKGCRIAKLRLATALAHPRTMRIFVLFVVAKQDFVMTSVGWTGKVTSTAFGAGNDDCRRSSRSTRRRNPVFGFTMTHRVEELTQQGVCVLYVLI
jgi:hypothetical protein